jgi:hypothetical protein
LAALERDFLDYAERFNAELTAYVVVKGGRLELRSRGREVVGWPLNRIAATPTGAAAVRVRGGAVLDGRFPFYELHAALLGDRADDGLGCPVQPPEAEQDRARTAAVLSEGLAELQRHLDQTCSVLPAFVRHRDAQSLASVGGGEPGWLKEQEG